MSIYPSNRVCACWWAVDITSGPTNLVGQYQAHGKENGKTKYRNEDTGAALHFDSRRKRWILVVYVDGIVDGSMYSSSVNANRDVPWNWTNGRLHMSGKSWEVDEGEGHSTPLKFAGTHAFRYVYLVTKKDVY